MYISIIPVQIFLCHPVVLESICYRTKAKRLTNESNTTGGYKKLGQVAFIPHKRTPNWGPLSSKFLQPSSHSICVDLLAYNSKPIEIRWECDRMAEKVWTGVCTSFLARNCSQYLQQLVVIFCNASPLTISVTREPRYLYYIFCYKVNILYVWSEDNEINKSLQTLSNTHICQILIMKHWPRMG